MKMNQTTAFLFTAFLFIQTVYSQEEVYIHHHEGIGASVPFMYSFQNGNGYLELYADGISDFLANPSERHPVPNKYGLPHYRIQGSYKLDNYRDFTILDFDKKKYLLLKADDKKVCLLAALQEDNFTPEGKNDVYGGRWYTFWGMNKEWRDRGILIGPGASIINYSSALKEEINGKSFAYESFAGRFLINRPSMWIEGSEGYGIGEYITLGPVYSYPGIIILNGFIAPWNLELYYSNARVKKIKIEYNDGVEEIHEIKDTPNPRIIWFKIIPTTPIKLTILDVYPGTLYQDTAISNILFLMQRKL